LTVANDAPRAEVRGRLWSVEGVEEAAGDSPGGEVTLFIDDGRLSYWSTSTTAARRPPFSPHHLGNSLAHLAELVTS